jgi:Nicotinate-nucleotide pyrophosphorylase
MISQGLVKLILSWIEEDAPLGDVTTEALIDKGIAVKAVVLAKDNGYACCLADFAEALNTLGLKARALKADGEPFHRGEVLMEITGDARVVLVLERSLLNALSYLMGVVRETRRVVELVRSVNPRVRVAATRKTIPGLRMLVKKAVSVGGADTIGSP